MKPAARQIATHIDAARTRLGHLGGLAARTDAAERNILKAAEKRLEAIRADLDRLRARVHTDEAAATQYQALTLEAGQLETIRQQARQNLGEP